MKEEYTCKDCWQFEEPKYSQRPGKCMLKIYSKPYKDTPACDQFDKRNEEVCLYCGNSMVTEEDELFCVEKDCIVKDNDSCKEYN